jgi:hypothetical protein
VPALRELPGHRQKIGKSAALTVGALSLARAAPALNDQQNLADLTMIAALTRARIIGKQGER